MRPLALRNPVLDRGCMTATRDPALIYQGGLFRCYHTVAEPYEDRYRLYVDLITSQDLRTWSLPKRLAASPLNFSSPGNVIRVGNQWALCVQSYPVLPGQAWGSEDSRLWLLRSRDLDTWRAPEPMHPVGCQANWTSSSRQIDPYLVTFQGRIWCLYKTSGRLGLMVSDDLSNWEEACPDHPVLSSVQTPDGATVENPCVVQREDGTFALFFAPCREGRGIGVAYSDDLMTWQDVHYLDLPPLAWAEGGPTAAMVLDVRDDFGAWVMMFHGERYNPQNAHDAALGVAWSQDLEHWEIA